MKKRFLQFILLLLASNIYAQTTIENFSYGTVTSTSADTLTNPAFGGTNWRRHSGTGGPIVYNGSSLSFPGYASSGVGGSIGFTFASGSREDANRSIIPYTSGNVYVSFLLNISASGGTTGDYFFHLLDTNAITSFRGRHYIKNGSTTNTFKIGLNKGSSAAPVYSTADYPLDSTIMVVVKYSFNSSVNDTIYTYVFTNSIPSTEPAVATLTSTDITTADMGILNAIAIRQGTVGTMAGKVDGFRISNTWGDGPLPVTFSSFDATLTDNRTTTLSWVTSSEINNKGFEIERSTEGNEFKKIGFVKGAGNSSKIQQYSFVYPSNESAFYRLKQLDFDGKYEYSNIAFVNANLQKLETVLMPNPFNDQIQITSNTSIDKVEIMDINGKMMHSQVVNNKSSNISTNDLPNGIYFIRIYSSEGISIERIMKSN
jgi:hypothetical protein